MVDFLSLNCFGMSGKSEHTIASRWISVRMAIAAFLSGLSFCFVGCNSDITLTGNSNEAKEIKFSKDGKRIFAATTSGVVVWDADSIKSITTLEAGKQFSNMTCSEDGKYLAATGSDCAIWDISTMSLVLDLSKVFPNCDSFANTPAFSESNRLFALSCKDRTSQKWFVAIVDLETGTVKKELKTGDGYWIPWVGFVSNGQKLISYTHENNQYDLPGNLVLWDITSGKSENGALTYLVGTFKNAELHPKLKALLVSGSLKTLLWDFEEKDSMPSRLELVDARFCVVDDKTAIIGGGTQGGLKIVDPISKSETAIENEFKIDYAVSNDKTKAVYSVGAIDNPIPFVLYDLAATKSIRRFNLRLNSPRDIQCVGIHPKLNFVVVGSKSGIVKSVKLN